MSTSFSTAWRVSISRRAIVRMVANGRNLLNECWLLTCSLVGHLFSLISSSQKRMWKSTDLCPSSNPSWEPLSTAGRTVLFCLPAENEIISRCCPCKTCRRFMQGAATSVESKEVHIHELPQGFSCSWLYKDKISYSRRMRGGAKTKMVSGFSNAAQAFSWAQSAHHASWRLPVYEL